MNENLLNILLTQIKLKNQIKDLPNEFILSRVEQFFLTNGDKRKKLEKEFENKKEKILKNKIFKEVLKSIREEIGILYGSYLTSNFSKKEKILKESFETEELLELHKSSSERIKYYYQIYSEIFSWYEPKFGIADLACGLNPLNFNEIKKIIKNKNLKAYASDLNPNDMKFIQNFFDENNISGIAKNHDITQMKFLEDKEFLECDLVFILKALDSFETIKKDISKTILEKIPQKNIVVSFPTKSIKSKIEFKPEKRNWLRNFLNKNNWKFKEFEIENELFFLIKK